EPGTPADLAAVAEVTAALMRGIEPLQSAAEIVAREPLGARETRGSSAPTTIASQALKVASAFDDLTDGDPDQAAAALEALYPSPGYVYTLRALEALERLLDRSRRPART